MTDIVELLKEMAVAYSRGSKMMADAKTQRNRLDGEPDSDYRGLEPEQTVEWRAAALIQSQSAEIARLKGEMEKIRTPMTQRQIDDWNYGPLPSPPVIP